MTIDTDPTLDLPGEPKAIVYTSQEAVMLTGMTYRQLDYAISTGLVTPSVSEGKGSGHARLFAAEDVWLLRVLAALRQQGAQGPVLRDAMRAVKELGQHKGGYLVLPPSGDAFITDDHNEAFVPNVLSFSVINLAHAEVD